MVVISQSFVSAYDEWVESTGVPIHRGYYVEDLRNLETGHWPERGCNAAFLMLAGQEGRAEARVTELLPGSSTIAAKVDVDEVVYVVEGDGMCRLWTGEGSNQRSFEWQDHSLFRLPRDCWHQLSNMRGDKPARLLHYSYLPIALAANPDPDAHFNNPYESPTLLGEPGEDLFSRAEEVHVPDGFHPGSAGIMYDYWTGNFFPDMKAWDHLAPLYKRGAGGRTVWIEYPKSKMTCHMSVFPSGTYKKAHRHGPGVVIVIPAGEGYSIMWEEGRKKVFIPWGEGSVFVPPDKWFHQHFSVGAEPARYLAVHPPRQFFSGENVEDYKRDQIEYIDEDPSVRETFERELSKRGLETMMPGDAYSDPNYEWTYVTESV